MDSDSDEWDPVKELRKQSMKRENPFMPNLYSFFSQETSKRLKLSLKRKNSSHSANPKQNEELAVSQGIRDHSPIDPAASYNSSSRGKSNTHTTSSLSDVSELLNEYEPRHNGTTADTKGSVPSSDCYSGTTIIPSSKGSRSDSRGSFQSTSTTLEPKMLSRNKARKSVPPSSTTKSQLELLEKRGFVTPRSKVVPVGRQMDDSNPMEGTSANYPAIASPNLMEDSPDSFLSQREHARTSLLERMEQETHPPTTEQERVSPHGNVSGTRFFVDVFPDQRKGVSALFFTHFHSRALTSLGASLGMPLYCSDIIAKCLRLLANHLNDVNLIRPIGINETITVDGVQVTALDANSCPGSVMFLFKLRTGEVILHTGTFRATNQIELLPQLSAGKISRLYLDTTYCYPGWNFPPRDEILGSVKRVVKQQYRIHGSGIVFLVACKMLGHEDLILAAASQLQSKIWAPPLKQSILRCLDDEDITERLVSDPRRARLHLVTLGDVHVKNLTEYLLELKPTFSHLLLFHPSGWHLENELRHKKSLSDDLHVRSYGRVKICPVPYSSHSGYSDLRRFVRRLRPLRIIPTVYSESEKQKKRMNVIFENWL